MRSRTVRVLLVSGSLWMLAVVIFSVRFTAESAAIATAGLRSHRLNQAAGTGKPWVHLEDMHQQPAIFTKAAGSELLERGLAKPAALAAADFDEDGVPDLISGYIGPSGGLITIQRGNVDSIFPNSPEARKRGAGLDSAGHGFSQEAFELSARVFGIPDEPDFLGAGDFDNDGHWDVVASARGSERLILLPGDGRGGFGAAKEIRLPGRVTALITGEMNRADGLTDVVAGIGGPDGPQILIFEGPEGALKAQAERLPLPAEASAMALGHLDDRYEVDLAVAAGSQLVIVHGRDRRLSLDESRQSEVKLAVIEQRSFPFAIRSIALGKFVFKVSSRTDIAMLDEKGEVHLLSAGARKAEGEERRVNLEEWDSHSLAPDLWPLASTLLSTKVSSLPMDDVVVLDRAQRRVHILSADPGTSGRGGEDLTDLSTRRPLTTTLALEGGPVALLPMRLNPDSLSDLVMLVDGSNSPIVAKTTAAMTFMVTNNGDNGGVNPAPGAGTGTLRQAIIDSNANPGADTIAFSIASGVQTITPAAALPPVTDPVTIDGTTQPGFSGNPIIELNGSTSGGAIGLVLSGPSTVRGLVINRFFDGIDLAAGSMSHVEGNFIGTNVAGTMGLGNTNDGFRDLTGSPNNTIGGTTLAARNVISGNNEFGVEFFGGGSTGNQVLGNFIGTDLTGTIDLGNSEDGVILNVTSGNTVGGTVAGARNVISGNNETGVDIVNAGTTMNLVQGNFIGTDVSGTLDVGNSGDGVDISGAPGNTVGGTAVGARNVVSGNNFLGVMISGTSALNLVQGNFIGTDATGTSIVANASDGVRIVTTSINNSIGGSATGAGNVLSGNGSDGVDIAASSNQVQGNFIGTDATGALPLGNSGRGVLITGSNNSVGGTASGVANTIAFNGNAGVGVASGIGNAIRHNSIHDNTALGIDLDAFAGVVTPNDPADPDPGPNNLQNWPALVSASSGGGSTTINGSLNSNPNTIFHLDFFSNAACDPSGHGEGDTFIGTAIVGPTDPAGNVIFTVTFSVPVVAGRQITATATNPNTNDTSEFSNCVGVPPQPCVITCPADVTKSSDSGQCGAVVNYPAPTTSGGCGTVTCSPASGSFFLVGTTTVTCSESGGANCSFKVKVTDDQPPTISCPADVTQTAPPGQCTGVVSYPAPTANDNCPGVTTSCLPPSGSIFQAGTTTVSCRATDAAGNLSLSTCTFTVTLNGSGSKIVILQDDSNGNCLRLDLCTGVYKWKTPTATIYTGHVTFTETLAGLNFQSVTGELNLLGGALRGNTGSARLTVKGPLTFTISDSDVTNNGPCP